ncbi:MAG: hypothetical protein Kow00109_26620 [Acidobacteriota bacterium]
MNRTKWLILFGAVALLAAVPGLAQNYDYNQVVQLQTRNAPAGTVNDPGSQLTYILDTGVNARELLGDVSLDSTSSSPLVDLAQWLDQDADGQLDPGAIWQNFVAITNTSPTMAVTVHFRYFNDNCDDVLDFLVVLTCDDTLIFDPFNFEIPGVGVAANTRNRIFGPQSSVFTPITTKQFGSGRFILTAAASGASIDSDDDAEILFPYELANGVGTKDSQGNPTGPSDCNINGVSSSFGTTLADTLSGNARNVGSAAGLNGNNLHVFNASQISFNYLVGYQTYAVPKGAVFQAGGINAWARPAVEYFDRLGGWNTGDGDFAPTGKLVSGGEQLYIWSAAASGWTPVAPGTPNNYYLRSEIQGGTINAVDGENADYGGEAYYGALGTPALLRVAPEDVIQSFVSVADDYNGSTNNAASSGFTTFPDLSANITAAVTTWVLEIFDNDEEWFESEEAVSIPVSPPVVLEEQQKPHMVCICLRTFLTTTIRPDTNVDSLTIDEIAAIYGDEVLNGGGSVADYDGILLDPDDDLSGGWIRFVRDNVTGPIDTSVDPDGANQGFASVAQWVGLTVVGKAHGKGTSTFDIKNYADADADGPSFFTGANIFLRQFGFGALSWDYTVASHPCTSDSSDPLGPGTGRYSDSSCQ